MCERYANLLFFVACQGSLGSVVANPVSESRWCCVCLEKEPSGGTVSSMSRESRLGVVSKPPTPSELVSASSFPSNRVSFLTAMDPRVLV